MRPSLGRRFVRSLAAAVALLACAPLPSLALEPLAIGWNLYPSDPRAAALGQAGATCAEGALAALWNPALLASEEGRFGVGLVPRVNLLPNLASDTFQSTGTAQLSVGSIPIVCTVEYLSVGVEPGLDINDLLYGSWHSHDLVLGVGTGFRAGDHVTIGVRPKWIDSRLGPWTTYGFRRTPASGPALDVGLAYERAVAGHRTRLAGVLQNYGPDLDFEGDSRPLPQVLRYGAFVESGSPPVKVRTSIELSRLLVFRERGSDERKPWYASPVQPLLHPRDGRWADMLSIGTEVSLQETVSFQVGLRRGEIGEDEREERDWDVSYGFVLGPRTRAFGVRVMAASEVVPTSYGDARHGLLGVELGKSW